MIKIINNFKILGESGELLFAEVDITKGVWYKKEKTTKRTKIYRNLTANAYYWRYYDTGKYVPDMDGHGCSELERKYRVGKALELLTQDKDSYGD